MLAASGLEAASDIVLDPDGTGNPGESAPAKTPERPVRPYAKPK
ncbi:MAG: hypothetical protein ACLUSP_07955 [Christensenellales bacterium]